MIFQTTTVAIADILGNVSTLVTSSVGWVGSFMGVITANPLIELFVITSFVGLGIGLIKRLIRL